MMTAPVSEIYVSVQGEGPYTGERQIFVRLAGCPLRCRYCDTPDSLIAKGHPKLTVAQVLKKVLELKRKTGAQTVSLTGGEPMVYATFLEQLLPALKKKKFRVYVETAGVHAKSLEKIAPWVDVVSMDIKLPSATGRQFWKEHREFLQAGGEKIFTKVVIERQSPLAEIKKAVALLLSVKKPPVLVLQPATPLTQSETGPEAEQLAEAYAWASSKLPRVLVMPQQHKIWGVR